MQQQKGRDRLGASIHPSGRLGCAGLQADEATEDAHQRGILVLAGAAQGGGPLAFIMQLTQQKMKEAGKPQLDLGRIEKIWKNGRMKTAEAEDCSKQSAGARKSGEGAQFPLHTTQPVYNPHTITAKKHRFSKQPQNKTSHPLSSKPLFKRKNTKKIQEIFSPQLPKIPIPKDLQGTYRPCPAPSKAPGRLAPPAPPCRVRSAEAGAPGAARRRPSAAPRRAWARRRRRTAPGLAA